MIRNIRNPQSLALALALSVSLLALPSLAADRDIDETVSADATGTVAIENIAGSIEVIGWDRDEVQVKGTISGDVVGVEISAGKRVQIEVEYPRNQKNMRGEADLVIHVPAGSNVMVECITATVEVSGVSGRVQAESISAGVMVEGDCSEVSAESISGDVLVNCPQASEVNVGSISGSVEATGGTADVRAEAISGPIDLTFDKFLNLSVEALSGRVTVTGDLDSAGRFDFELHSGRLLLTVPADVDAEFSVETFSGGIDNAFGQKSRKTSKYTPNRELDFTNGNGSARVDIETFSGDVILKKN
ncbi:MAG: DUF4097 and DUF4098 domain-containing protein YvlB [Candidatus Krumholzibacteriia bacterium]|jgi:DUF4097 and DUF4098 domain-containing protein YvlB